MDKKHEQRHPALELLDDMADMIGTAARMYHFNQESCRKPFEAEAAGVQRVRELFIRVHKSRDRRIRFGPHVTIECMGVFMRQIALHIHMKLQEKALIGGLYGGYRKRPWSEELADFLETVTMYAVPSDQDWGLAFDDIVHGE